MTRSELEQAIRAACDVADDTEVWVFGSQSILGQFPNAPQALRQSVEADIAPRNYPERVDRIDGALGELSRFHWTHGFYVHAIESATLPSDWRRRTVPVPGRGARESTGYCLEGHDLAASKLVAFREKDQEFVRVLLAEHMINFATLLERVASLPISSAQLVGSLPGSESSY